MVLSKTFLFSNFSLGNFRDLMKLYGNYLKERRYNISCKAERQILYNETSNILFGIALQNNLLFLKKISKWCCSYHSELDRKDFYSHDSYIWWERQQM